MDEHVDAGTDRRSFLGLMALGALGVAAIAGAAAAAVFASGGAARRSARAPSCVPAGAATRDAPRLVRIELRTASGWSEHVERRGAYVDRLDDGSVRAFSATCPHAGCFVEWRAQSSEYLCPCHGSKWSRDGELLDGPARRGLDPLPVTLLPDGSPQVCYKAFALDMVDRIEVG